MRVSVRLAALPIPEYLDFHSSFSAPRSRINSFSRIFPNERALSVVLIRRYNGRCSYLHGSLWNYCFSWPLFSRGSSIAAPLICQIFKLVYLLYSTRVTGNQFCFRFVTQKLGSPESAVQWIVVCNELSDVCNSANCNSVFVIWSIFYYDRDRSIYVLEETYWTTVGKSTNMFLQG